MTKKEKEVVKLACAAVFGYWCAGIPGALLLAGLFYFL